MIDPTKNNFFNPMLKAGLKAREKNGHGLYRAMVYHDDDCPFLAGKGPCCCEPEVRIELWRKT